MPQVEGPCQAKRLRVKIWAIMEASWSVDRLCGWCLHCGSMTSMIKQLALCSFCCVLLRTVSALAALKQARGKRGMATSDHTVCRMFCMRCMAEEKHAANKMPRLMSWSSLGVASPKFAVDISVSTTFGFSQAPNKLYVYNCFYLLTCVIVGCWAHLVSV